MKWLLIDNIMPNQPALINLDKIDCISWDSGTLLFECSDGQKIEYECEKSVFVDIASSLDIVKEVE